MEYLHVDDTIQLESIQLHYADTIFKAIDRNRSFLRKWLPFVDQTSNVSDTRAFIHSVTGTSSDERDDVYMIWFKGEFAGLIGYKDTDYVNAKTELGYWLIDKFQGKGIMVRSVQKLMDFAFHSLHMNRIQIKVAVGNSSSSAIPKRLNFHFEGIEREGEKHRNRYLDLEVYSFLKKEWMTPIQEE
jgi:ribosomal-protein-serine acetyltransferase